MTYDSNPEAATTTARSGRAYWWTNTPTRPLPRQTDDQSITGRLDT
jgi:hypothetical protein